MADLLRYRHQIIHVNKVLEVANLTVCWNGIDELTNCRLDRLLHRRHLVHRKRPRVVDTRDVTDR